MHTKFKSLLLVLPILLLALIWGCSDNSSSTNNNNTTGDQNLTDVFGGYNPTNEAPAFGDPTLQAMGDDQSAEDNMESDSVIDSLQHQHSRDIYAVRFLWGNLQYDSSETESTDWSGSLTIDRGAIVAIRLVGFERGDHIIRPRSNRRKIEFVSHTREAHDGILLYVYDPNPASYPEPNKLTFGSVPYSHTYTMADLDSIDEVVDVGNNQFSVNGFKIGLLQCENGFLDGQWQTPKDSTKRGEFMGRWISKDGLIFGHVKGHFGTLDDGSKVLFGKWIGAFGQFHAFVKGTWGYADDVDPLLLNRGWVTADLFNKDSVQIGTLTAEWISGFRVGDHAMEMRHWRGFLRGEWAENCN